MPETLDSTLLALAGVAGLHYAATAYVAGSAKNLHRATPDGDKLTAVGHVSSLHIYPVKSLGRMDVNSLNCADIGVYLAKYNLFDRHFIVIKGNGRMATMREFSRMALVTPRVWGEQMHLDAPGMPTLTIPCSVEKTDSSVIHKVDVHGQNTYGIDCGKAASDWMSTFLQRPNAKLLYFAPTMSKRPARGGFFGEVEVEISQNVQLAFPDASPYNLLSESSIDVLNKHLEKPVSVHNFRPNIVVSGCPPNSEDTWDKVQIGNTIFKCVTHDPRCVMTTVDPITGIKDPAMEPLRTLRSYRPIAKFDCKSPMLGVYMVMEKAGEIRVGDTVYASTKTPEWK